MAEKKTVDSPVDVARQTAMAAGCASLISLDESDYPSSRAVAAFPPDNDFSRIVIGNHPDTRKTMHIRRDPRVALSCIDMSNRGYVTVIGSAHFNHDLEERKRYWTERFSAFFPKGPESGEYELIIVVPERLELRSFGLGVAEEPTHWSPVILRRSERGAWEQAN